MSTPHMADQAPPVHSLPAIPDEPKYKRLTQAELGVVLTLTNEGKTQTQIAQAIGCTPSAISHALKRLGTDTTVLAKHAAKASSYRAVRRLDAITRKGKDQDAIKASSKLLEVAELVDSKGSTQVGVQVIVGMPGAPAGPDPLGGQDVVIEAKVVNRLVGEGDAGHNS